MYINQSTNEVLSINQLREALPNTSIPGGADCSHLGYPFLVETLRPAPLPWHRIEAAPPVNNIQHWAQVALSPLEIEGICTSALERHYDSVAQTRQYDNRFTCSLRAGYPGAFQAEGLAFAVWMDQCNALAYQIMQQVVSGDRSMPVSIEALISDMPISPFL